MQLQRDIGERLRLVEPHVGPRGKRLIGVERDHGVVVQIAAGFGVMGDEGALQFEMSLAVSQHRLHARQPPAAKADNGMRGRGAVRRKTRPMIVAQGTRERRE